MQQSGDNISSATRINYYVLTAMFAGIILVYIVNANEPQVDSQVNLIEIIYSCAQAAPGIFALSVSSSMGWTTKVFGRAYLALGIGFICESIGSTIFTIYLVKTGTVPYPGLPDVFIIIYFCGLLCHLIISTRFVKKKLTRRNKMLLIILPAVVTSIYIPTMLVPSCIPGSVPNLLSKQLTVGNSTFEITPISSISNSDPYQHFTAGNQIYDLIPLQLPTDTPYPQTLLTNSTFSLIPITFSHFTIGSSCPPSYIQQSMPAFFAGIFYNTITVLNLSWAIIAAGVYRRSFLGNAWGLLLFGIGLTVIGDLVYDFESVSMNGSNNVPDFAFWIFGGMVISYALYLHRRIVKAIPKETIS